MISNFPDKSKFHLWKNHFLESKVADFDHHIQQLFIKHNRDNCNQRILVVIIPITTTGFEIPLAFHESKRRLIMINGEIQRPTRKFSDTALQPLDMKNDLPPLFAQRYLG